MDKEKDTAMGPNEVMAERVSLTTTVEKVDIKKRQLTLKEDTGNVIKLEVPQDVADIGKIKKGDKLAIDYYASIALQLVKRTAQPGAEETTVAAKEPAKLPGGLVAKKVSATVEVVKVDTSNNLVTIKGPGGEMDTIHVDDPAMQSDLAKLKKGDKIKASYAQAVAITVTPQQKATKQSSREPTPEEQQQNNGAPTKEY